MAAVDALRLVVVDFGAIIAVAADVHVRLAGDFAHTHTPAVDAAGVAVRFRGIRQRGPVVAVVMLHVEGDWAGWPVGGLSSVVDVEASVGRHPLTAVEEDSLVVSRGMIGGWREDIRSGRVEVDR